MEVGTQLVHTSLSQDPQTAFGLAGALVDGWRQRVLAHADVEEQDLFPVVVDRLPELRENVAALIRDHEMMRLLVAEIEQELDRARQVMPDVLDRLTTLLHVQRLHSAFEEETVLSRVSGVLTGFAQPSEGAAKSWPNV
jgi:hypothetical protein